MKTLKTWEDEHGIKWTSQTESEKSFVSYCLENYGQPLRQPSRAAKVRMAEFNDRIKELMEFPSLLQSAEDERRTQ